MDLIGLAWLRAAGSLCVLPEHGPHVGDVVLLNGHREHPLCDLVFFVGAGDHASHVVDAGLQIIGLLGDLLWG
jgi:hypothetical protein